jgi:alginate O-acetyltransferase complex protein AlgI
MLLGGLWHGANFTYVIWGAWHGMWLAIERALGVDAAPRTINPLKWAFTFLLVVTGWVIFRAENLDVAWRMYAAMFEFSDWRLSDLTLAQLTSLQIGTLVLAYGVIVVFGLRQFYTNPLASRAPKAKAGEEGTVAPLGGATAVAAGVAPAYAVALGRLLVLLLFVASVLKLSAQSFSPFLYFQF